MQIILLTGSKSELEKVVLKCIEQEYGLQVSDEKTKCIEMQANVIEENKYIKFTN